MEKVSSGVLSYKNVLSGKNILVCGIAKSGISAAILLKSLGAHVTVSDIKQREKVEADALYLEENGISLFLGKNPDDIINEFELVVVSPGIPYDLPFLNKARSLGIEVISEVELSYRLCRAKIIAITGTNGKTTTTALTGEIMDAFYDAAFTVGNIGVPFCSKVSDATENGIMVAEISSFQMETAKDFKPWISAVLNITPDHLNRHKTMEKYIEAKEMVFKNQEASDYTVLNYDDESCRAMAEKTNADVIFFSRKEQLEKGIFVRGNDIYIKWQGIDEALINKSELHILGEHNVENVMAASAISLCAGVSLDVLRNCLKKFKGVEHRIEYVRTFNDVDYYNDSKATNSDAAIKALEAINKPIVLIGGGRDKTGDFSDWIKLFEGRVKCVVALGEAADLIIETCKAYNFMNFYKANTMKDAVEISASKADAGDCVLLSPACASFDMFDNYEQRGEVYKEFVRNLH